MGRKDQVGIKELKDSASAVINNVIKSRRPVTITRNNREVAKIIPSEQDLYTRLADSGLIGSRPKLGWKSLRLERIGKSSLPAVQSIGLDREQR
jgi:prevent-host-death family protein